MYTSCLFSMSLNGYIVHIKKTDGICSPTFVEDDFSGLFLYVLIFFYQRFKICINNKTSFIRFFVLIKP